MMNGKYYVIDLSKLDNLTLNYGKDYKTWGTLSNPDYKDYQDLYIINVVTHQIYYPHGIHYNDDYYFSKTIDNNVVSQINLPSVTDDFENRITVNSTSQTVLSSYNISLSANITLDLSEDYKENSLEYAWVNHNDTDKKDEIEFSKFSLNSEKSATLTSKAIDNTYDKYYLWIKILDVNGNTIIKTKEAKILKIENMEDVSYYGQAIDYDVDLGKDADGNNMNLIGTSDYDWEIFYNDGTNIYIIAEDYVPLTCTLMPTGMGNNTSNISTHPYSLYWDDDSEGIQNGRNGAADIFGSGASSGTKYIADKYLSTWKAKTTTSTNSNAKMVATLMDTSIWNNFANSSKIGDLTAKSSELVAIGGPTLEMWVSSWNQKHGNSSDDASKYELYYDANETGYYLETPAKPENINTTTGYSDKLYYPRTSSYKNCNGYWVASPYAELSSTEKTEHVFRVGYAGGVLGRKYDMNSLSVRPVVCLPSDITAVLDSSTEVWHILQK